MNENIKDAFFMRFSCTILGAMTGFLIALPMFSSLSYGSFTILIFTLLGGVIGHKRAGRPFLYFLLFCVLVLSSLVISSLKTI